MRVEQPVCLAPQIAVHLCGVVSPDTAQSASGTAASRSTRVQRLNQARVLPKNANRPPNSQPVQRFLRLQLEFASDLLEFSDGWNDWAILLRLAPIRIATSFERQIDGQPSNRPRAQTNV